MSEISVEPDLGSAAESSCSWADEDFSADERFPPCPKKDFFNQIVGPCERPLRPIDKNSLLLHSFFEEPELLHKLCAGTEFVAQVKHLEPMRQMNRNAEKLSKAAVNLPSISPSPTTLTRNVAAIHRYVTSFGFNPGVEYKGPTSVYVRDPLTGQEVSGIRFAGDIVLPRYPSPSGHANREGFFCGELMRQATYPGLEKQVGPYGPDPLVYLIRNGVDAAVLPNGEQLKVGQSEQRKTRRSQHESNSPLPTKLVMGIRPQKYTTKSLEAMLLATLRPWCTARFEHVVLPYAMYFDFANCRDERQLIQTCVVYSTPTGILLANQTQEGLVHGRIVHNSLTESRQIELNHETSHQLAN